MKDFDYIIIGGGCAGLSLAYELQIHKKLENKTLGIIEPRTEYKKDKTWSFWKVFPHNFEDCVEKNWKNFSINIPSKTNFLECNDYPYQSINSGAFYKKINSALRENKNIKFFKNINEVNVENSFVFNSVPLPIENNDDNLWQHFCGIEIETKSNIFDDTIINLMDFDCDQRESVHFFYTLPYSKNKALVETTWLSKMSNNEKNYDKQLQNYIETNLKIKNYKIVYKEVGAIPLFYPSIINKNNNMNIGTAGLTAAASIKKIIDVGIDKDKPILVSGATGGVGSVAVNILNKLGYIVHALTGKNTEEDFLKSIGASLIISREEFMENPIKSLDKSIYGGAVDTVGGNILAKMISMISPKCSISTCGNVAGMNLNTNVFPFILRGVSLIGIDSAESPIEFKESIWELLANDWKVDLEPYTKTIKLNEVGEEIDKILDGKQVGRVVIKHGD